MYYLLPDKFFLINIRKKHNLSQQQVADLLFVSRPTYSFWEKNPGSIPLCKLKLICESFDLNPEDFLNKKIINVLTLKNQEERMHTLFEELESVSQRLDGIKMVLQTIKF